MINAIGETQLDGLQLFRRGKVRDTYHLGEDLLMVATDRLSAFDVVLPTAIPDKGKVLTQLSRFWFEQTQEILPNHVISANVDTFPTELLGMFDDLAGRSMIVKRAERIDIECVVRAYLAGSAWQEYRQHGSVCGRALPTGLAQAQRLSEPIFTPAIKNDAGHDENISVEELGNRVGTDLARRLEVGSLQLYRAAAEIALGRGIIIADTKFEFGFIDRDLSVIDELVTPDSSRFWEARSYRPGVEQPSFDKQFVRDWLTGIGWDKSPPGPELPPHVVAGTSRRYIEAYERLTGTPFSRNSEA